MTQPKKPKTRTKTPSKRAEPAPSEDGQSVPRRRPSLRDAQKAFTRQLLIEAAVEVFDREGYAGATIDEIVTSASATRATFYQHFSGKQEVIAALIDHVGVEGERLFVTAWDPGGLPPTRRSVREWLENVCDFFTTHSSALKAIRAAAEEDRELRTRLDGVLKADIELLSAYLERVGCDYPPRIYATALIAQLDEYFGMWLLRDWDLEQEQTLEMFTSIWASALRVN